MTIEPTAERGCPKCGANRLKDHVCFDCGSSTWLMPSGTIEIQQSDKCRIAELQNAIRTHREQKADDRCIEDDDRLYEVLGDGIKCDRQVGDKAAMLANCQRFIERRCEGGGWPTYAELEREVERLTGLVQLANKKALDDCMAIERLTAASEEAQRVIAGLRQSSFKI